MKVIGITVFILITAAILFAWRFPIKFNYVLSNESQIDNIIEQLGEPDKTFEKLSFPREIIETEKNKNANKVYYWLNGSDSYHYIAVDLNGKVVNHSSVGW